MSHWILECQIFTSVGTIPNRQDLNSLINIFWCFQWWPLKFIFFIKTIELLSVMNAHILNFPCPCTWSWLLAIEGKMGIDTVEPLPLETGTLIFFSASSTAWLRPRFSSKFSMSCFASIWNVFYIWSRRSLCFPTSINVRPWLLAREKKTVK